MLIYFYTFGCKVNQYETEILRQQFEQNGFICVNRISDADVCVVNSCTVTAQSDLKLRQLLHKIRRENPGSIIALCGCYPQAFADVSNIIPEADIIVGSGNKTRLPSLVKRFVENHERIVEIDVENSDYPSFEQLTHGSSKTRGIIKIQDGCDRFCSYCIIPYARGRSRSKSLCDISAEAKTLVKAGHTELVVVGINLSDYGKGTEYDLADAVKAVSESGAERIRLGSLEPEELTVDIIDRLASIPNLCPHFHLALQSGCNKTLKEMRRKYDKSEYFTLVKLLRERFQHCAITTDIMVGFPGETDDDFMESLDFVKMISFSNAHIFPYPVPGRQGEKHTQRDF